MATRGEGFQLMNRLDQLELHKAMAMELKWMLSKGINRRDFQCLNPSEIGGTGLKGGS